MLVAITNFFPDTIATTITSTSAGAIIGGSLSGVIALIVIIIGTIICVAAIHSKKKSRRLNVMPPSASMTMTTMPRSISATNINATSINATVYYDQPQEGPPLDYEATYEDMAWPAPNIESFWVAYVIAYNL